MGERLSRGSPGRWRRLGASVLGTSHDERGTPCQDFSATTCIELDEGEILILIASDGAGSASHSDVGSRLACETLLFAADAWFVEGHRLEHLEQPIVEYWLLDVLAAIADAAAERGVPPRELACTLLLALVGQNRAWFSQIGDGAIVIRKQTGYEAVFWPMSGEYANMTYFLTQPEALTRVQHEQYAGPVDEVAIFTDGIQTLALRYSSRQVHEPFFRPLFAALRQQPPGESGALSGPLISFLSSPQVNDRTDDDKTLVLATRCPPEPPPALPVAPSIKAEASTARGRAAAVPKPLEDDSSRAPGWEDSPGKVTERADVDEQGQDEPAT